jgi:hypothetical protein
MFDGKLSVENLLNKFIHKNYQVGELRTLYRSNEINLYVHRSAIVYVFKLGWRIQGIDTSETSSKYHLGRRKSEWENKTKIGAR